MKGMPACTTPGRWRRVVGPDGPGRSCTWMRIPQRCAACTTGRTRRPFRLGRRTACRRGRRSRRSSAGSRGSPAQPPDPAPPAGAAPGGVRPRADGEIEGARDDEETDAVHEMLARTLDKDGPASTDIPSRSMPPSSGGSGRDERRSRDLVRRDHRPSRWPAELPPAARCARRRTADWATRGLSSRVRSAFLHLRDRLTSRPAARRSRRSRSATEVTPPPHRPLDGACVSSSLAGRRPRARSLGRVQPRRTPRTMSDQPAHERSTTPPPWRSAGRKLTPSRARPAAAASRHETGPGAWVRMQSAPLRARGAMMPAAAASTASTNRDRMASAHLFFFFFGGPSASGLFLSGDTIAPPTLSAPSLPGLPHSQGCGRHARRSPRWATGPLSPTSWSGSTPTGAPRTTSRSARSTCSTTRSCASRCAPSTSSRACSATGARRPA